MNETNPCPQCGHSADQHWPNVSNRPTTACVRCQNDGITTDSPAGYAVRHGICCMRADAITVPAPVPSGGGDSDPLVAWFHSTFANCLHTGPVIQCELWAKNLLASDWLAAHVAQRIAEARAEAAEQIAQAIEALTSQWGLSRDHERAIEAAARVARTNPYRLSGSEGDEQR